MKDFLGNNLELRPVSPDYLKVNYINDAIGNIFFLGIPLVAAILVTCFSESLVWTIILWVVVALALIIAVIDFMLIARRVRALGYAELPEELAIRKGIMFQKLVMVPYGRMQQVNVETGPILSRYGLAKLELVTASAATNAEIPGLPLAEAERLREKLTELGRAHMEGL